MELNYLVLFQLLLILFNQSVATPVPHEKRDGMNVWPDELMDLHVKYKGLYFGVANTACSREEWRILIDTVEATMPMMQESLSNPQSSAGWNRYFVQDQEMKKLKGGKGWTSTVSFLLNQLSHWH